MHLPDSFTSFIAQHGLFTTQSRILAAVSGGKDSVLMAHLLKAGGYNFGIAHCNFQLRGTESEGDEHFCRQLAEQLQVPFYTTRFDTEYYAEAQQISIQMAARELRYSWFEQLRQQHSYNVIAVAHHQNDTIETILLNLTRGTGIAGLHGIRPVNGSLVRPMLCFTQEQIEQLSEKNGLAYREDSSNASDKYARNKLRHAVVPHLQQLNPNLEQTFQRNQQYFQDLEAVLQYQVAQLQSSVWGQVNGVPALAVNIIQHLPASRLLLFELLKPYSFNRTTIENLLDTIGKHSGRRFVSATHQLTLDRDWILLESLSVKIEPVEISESDKHIIYTGHRLNIYGAEQSVISGNRYTAMVDSALLKYPLLLRPWQQGDFFYPLGMRGRKKLSDFFISRKVPLSAKSRIPVLANHNGEIIWVAGYRLDDRYKITAQTQKVTIFELQEQHHE